MHRKLLSTTALIAIGVLAACGSQKADSSSYGFSGTDNIGAPFELTVTAGPIDNARDVQRVTDAQDHPSMSLGEANCASPDNGDELYEITFKVEPKNGSAPDLNLVLSVEDDEGVLLSPSSKRSVSIAWLTEERATCQVSTEELFGHMSVSKDEGYQVKGLIILPGGAGNYDDYKLNVTTNGTNVSDLKGGALPYKSEGVTVELVA